MILDYQKLYDIVFSGGYPGYTPKKIESPNGDNMWDDGKKYAHIAKKYLDTIPESPEKNFLYALLYEALVQAQYIAEVLGIPKEFFPDIEDSTIRILYYAPGAVSNPHYDFDLFTTVLYRNDPKYFKYIEDAPSTKIQILNKQIHYGEILELIDPLKKATYHEVASSNRSQKSIVFFAMPKHSAVLPSGQTVGEWVKKRIERSRKYEI